MQTLVAKWYLGNLSTTFQTEISVDKFYFTSFKSLKAKSLLVRDMNGDTLIFGKELSLQFEKISLEKEILRISRMNLDGGIVHISRDKGGIYRHQFLLSNSKEKKKNNWLIDLDEISINDSRFTYDDDRRALREEGVDYNHLSFSNINSSLSDFKIFRGMINGEVVELSAREKKIDIKSVKTCLLYSPQQMEFNDLFADIGGSHLRGNYVMKYHTLRDFSDFSNLVDLDFEIMGSYLKPMDLGLFANSKEFLKCVSEFSGILKGRLSNLDGRDLIFKNECGLAFKGRFDLKGLPKIENTLLDIQLTSANISGRGVETSFVGIKVPDELYNLGNIRFDGDFFGYINDFVANGNFRTDIGSFNTDLNFKTKNEIPNYSGILNTSNFNLGRLFNLHNLGAVTFKGSVSGSGLDLENLNADADGKIASLNLLDYDYTGISFKGNIQDKKFIGNMISRDKYFDLTFDGSINLKSETPEYNFVSNINNIDFVGLGLIKDEAALSGKMIIDLEGSDLNNLIGSVKLNDASIQSFGSSVPIEYLDFIAQSTTTERRKLSLRSDIGDADLNGNFYLENIEAAVRNYLSRIIPKHISPVDLHSDEQFTFSANLKKPELLQPFFSTLEIDPGVSSLFGYFDGGKNDFDLSFQSGKVIYKDYQISNPLLKFNGKENEAKVDFSADNLVAIDSVWAKSILLSGIISNDRLDFNFDVNSDSTVNQIHLSGLFDGDTLLEQLQFDDGSFVRLDDQVWNFSPSGRIMRANDKFTFDEFLITNDTHFIYLRGIVSDKEEDELQLVVNNFELSQLNPWLAKYKTELAGEAFLEVKAYNLLGEPKFSTDFESCDFTLDGEQIGDLEVHTNYDRQLNEMLVDLRVQNVTIPNPKAADDAAEEEEVVELQTPLLAKGKVKFGSESPILDLNIKMDKSTISPLNKLLRPNFDEINGIASANLRLYGSLAKPLLKGSASLDTANVRVSYLNTSYTLIPSDSNRIEFTETSIDFKKLVFYDQFGTASRLGGTINHKFLKETQLNLKVDVPKPFEILDTEEEDNDLFYGKGFATGSVLFTGPVKNMDIIVAIKSEKGTLIKLPLDDDDGSLGGSFVHFINPADTTITNENNLTDFYPFKVNIDLELTPNAEVQLIYDRVAGDVISARGSGDLRLQVDRYGDLSMSGDYTISRGEYLFTYENLINKRFLVNEGGTLIWDGDPYDATMNLSAVYKLRASPKDLIQYGISDSSATDNRLNRRIPVEVQMLLSGKLLTPDIAFDIKMPTINESDLTDPIALGLREINSLEEKQNVQVFGLLILGRFINPQAGISFSGAGVNSVSELISNQLTNLLSQYTGNLSVGIAYRDDQLFKGGNLNGGELQLALNTTLFNDRILIDGNFDLGNEYNNNNIGTDFSVEYKITEDGKLRVRAFNELDDRQLLSNYQTNYRQGVGISFRKDFDDVSELYEEPLKKFGARLKKAFPKISSWFSKKEDEKVENETSGKDSGDHTL